jgi:hypothetical protein
MKKLPLFLFIAAIGIGTYLWIYSDGGNVKIKTGDGQKTETPKIRKKGGAKKYEETQKVQKSHIFHKIEVDGILDVIVTYGNEEKVEIEAPDGTRRKANMYAKSGTLFINLDHNTASRYTKGSKIRVYATKLNHFTIGGICSVRLENTLKDDSFSIKSGGGASFAGKVEVEEAEIELGGNASMNLSGAATKANIDLSGGSKLEGYEFKVNDLTVDMSGLSKGKITCLNSLQGKVSGISKLSYDGNPSVKSVKISGSAAIKAR